jgi:hypothetical protein
VHTVKEKLIGTKVTMSEEERELLARIGQLAGLCPPFYDNARFTDDFEGQINRHKNQQTGPRFSPNSHPAHHRCMLRSKC